MKKFLLPEMFKLPPDMLPNPTLIDPAEIPPEQPRVPPTTDPDTDIDVPDIDVPEMLPDALIDVPTIKSASIVHRPLHHNLELPGAF